MPEFEPDEESLLRAEKLSSKLINDVFEVSGKNASSDMRREYFSMHRYDEQAAGVPINDVLSNIRKMASEFALARRWDDEILCLKLDDGSLAPISLTEFFGHSFFGTYESENWIDLWERHFPFPFPPHRFWREILHQSKKREDRFRVVNLDDAAKGIYRNLEGFLSFRFAGFKKWGEWIHGSILNKTSRPTKSDSGSSTPPPPPAVGTGGGLQVQVSCLTPGLRIHVSPSYFINWVYFGSPTTPVTSYILPGRYIFAGDGPMLQKLTRDDGVFCIPPTYHPNLTRF